MNLRKCPLFLSMTLVLLGGCGGSENRVIVGSKHFTEQRILAEMICHLVERNTDLEVDRRLGLQGTKVAFTAILEGDIDVYPEYTGTALINILNQDYDRTATQDEIFEQVSDTFSTQWSLAWLDPLGFANTYVYAMRQEHAAKLNVTQISELEQYSDSLKAGFDHEFTTRPEYRQFEEVYGFTFANVTTLAPDLMYRALKNGEVDVIDAFSTDGRIRAYDFRMLEDNEGLFPPYDAAIVIRQDLVKRHPEVRRQLEKLSGKITVEEMRKLNYEVSENLKAPTAVAETFLRQKGLIQ